MNADEIQFMAKDGGVVCLDVVAMLRAMHQKDTPENRDAICKKIINEMRRQQPGVKIVAVQGGGGQN